MNVTQHKNGRITITLTRDEAEDAFGCTREKWAANDSSWVYDAAVYGYRGAAEHTNAELLADLREQWSDTLDELRELAPSDSTLADLDDRTRTTDPEIPAHVTLRIEKYTPSVSQRVTWAANRAYHRASARVYKRVLDADASPAQ